VVDVEALTLRATNYRVILRSQGSVSSPTQTTLVSRVAGTVQEAPFQAGAFVSSGAVLIRLDEQDLELALRELTQQGAQAQASLQEAASEEEAAAALAALAEERVEIEAAELARIAGLAKQGVSSDSEITVAKRNHVAARTTLATQETRLQTLRAGRRVLREQLGLIATRVAKARLDLARAQVRAPFTARVLSRAVTRGQYVTAGTPLAVIHGLDRVELRLPISFAQQRYLGLSHGHGPAATSGGPRVKIRSRAGGASWVGRVLRSEALVDPESRQLFAVAEVLEPYGTPSEPASEPLRVGEFVSAEIEGQLLEGVFVIPRSASPLPGQVLVISADDVLRREEVEVLWSDAESLVVSGLEAGERLCTTPVVFAGESVKVRVHEPGVPSK
tara:strand:+ start:1290 stop:2456 length:1167 start_codon:yes stop_codon:yes gene_type:complete